jgi:glycosyltransferase involved in cell wall biosynthesis
MKVLHVSHTTTISGGEHSLLTLLPAIPGQLELGVACPEGDLARAVRALGLPVPEIVGTSGSFRLHPVRTPGAFAEIAAAALAVSRIARRHQATVLYANSVRAGLITTLAARLSGLRSVVHVRDVLPGGAAAGVVKQVLTRYADELIAISAYVARSFAVGGCPRRIPVIDNPVDSQRFDPGAYDAADCRRRLGLDSGTAVVGIVGQITPWKGHDTAVRALARVRLEHPHARLVIVGEVKFANPGTSLDNTEFLKGLQDLAQALGVSGAVAFLGERDDIPSVLKALDVLLVPSTVEPFGRTVAEAMTMGTPVIATSEGGPRELLTDGVSGHLAPPGDAAAWASRINWVLSNRSAARRMTATARRDALLRFGVERHARAVLAVLDSAASGFRF